MEVVLVRRQKREHDTIGELYINGQYFCATLEPKDRGLDPNVQKSGKEMLNIKIKKYTAIPVYDNYLIHMNIASPDGFGKIGGHGGKNPGGRPNFAHDEKYKHAKNNPKHPDYKKYHYAENYWVEKVNKDCTYKGRNRTAYNPKVCNSLNDGNHINFYNTQIFEGIAFHNGADYHNTEGCILVGKKMPAGAFKEEDYQIFCQLYDKLWTAWKNNETIKFKVTYDEQLAKQAEQHNAEPIKPNEC